LHDLFHALRQVSGSRGGSHHAHSTAAATSTLHPQPSPPQQPSPLPPRPRLRPAPPSARPGRLPMGNRESSRRCSPSFRTWATASSSAAPILPPRCHRTPCRRSIRRSRS
jgi:hypothetical protein